VTGPGPRAGATPPRPAAPAPTPTEDSVLGLDGKRVVVTGGTRGIGRAVTLALARSGATVVATYRGDEEAADQLLRELKEFGEGHRAVRSDVRDPAAATALAEEVRAGMGGLDVLVNNAGVEGHVPLPDLDLEEWRRVMDTNLTGMFLVTRAMLPLLAEGGSIVNVGGAIGLRGQPGRAHHTASKAAVIGLSRSLAKELGPQGIRVNTVAPGIVETEPDAALPPPVAQRLRGMTALGRLATPEEVAGAVLYLAGDLSSYVTGATLQVDGGI
jgi:3-oxoacyl-[acyl-carrier protein] reductase